MTQKILLRASLVFPVTATHTLLAIKKQKIGAGFLNGVGGGVENDETPEESALREAFEEWKILIPPHSLHRVGVIDFHNNAAEGKTFTCRVYTFLADSWDGEPQEGTEMGLPTLFPKNNLPLAHMMPADRDWLPPIMRGGYITAQAWYGPEQKSIIKPTEVSTVSPNVLTRF